MPPTHHERVRVALLLLFADALFLASGQNPPDFGFSQTTLTINEDGRGNLQCTMGTCSFIGFVTGISTGSGMADAMQTIAAPVVTATPASATAPGGVLQNLQVTLSAMMSATATGTLSFDLVPDKSADPALAPAESSITISVSIDDSANEGPTVKTFTLVVKAVNDPPVVGMQATAAIMLAEDAAPFVQMGFLTMVAAGPATATNELPPHPFAQTITSRCTTDAQLFTAQPTITIDPTTGNGDLSFTLAPNAETSQYPMGALQVECDILDGGTPMETCVAMGCPVRFALTVTPSNDPPVATIDPSLPIPPAVGRPTLSIQADGGTQTFPRFLRDILPADPTNVWEQPPNQLVSDPISCTAATMGILSGAITVNAVTGMLTITPQMGLMPLPASTDVTCTVTDTGMMPASINIVFRVDVDVPTPVYPPLPLAPMDRIAFSLYPPAYPDQFVRRWSPGELTVKLPSPAPTGVTLFPSGVGLMFQPNPIVLAPFEQSKTFRVYGVSAGDIPISWTVSDTTYFEEPPTAIIKIKENLFTFQPSPLPTAYVNKTSSAITVRVAAAVLDSVTLSCSGPGGMEFNPTSLTWTASTPPAMTKTFTIRHPRVEYNALISCSVSGNDKDDFDPPAITIDVRPQFQFTPSQFLDMRVGDSKMMSVRVFKPPTSTVVLTPTSPSSCIAFDPPDLTFTQQQDTVPFTVKASCGGDHPVFYTLSGASAAEYDTPIAPDIAVVVELAWGIRFGKMSFFPSSSSMTVRSIPFNTPFPPIYVELTDSNGILDSTNNDVVITVSVSDGTVTGNVAQMVNGVATFDQLRFLDHPVNPMFTFTASSATTLPVNGKTLVDGPVAISPVPAYTMRFAQVGSLFTAQRQSANITSNTAFAPIVIELVQSDGSRDVNTQGVVVTASSDKGGTMAGDTATFAGGIATFNMLMFTNLPDKPTITFIASSAGGHPVTGTTLTTGIINVTPETCGMVVSTVCTCTGAADGAICDDSNPASVMDRCYGSRCRGVEVTGFTTVPPEPVLAGTAFTMSFTGVRLPSTGSTVHFLAPGGNCSRSTAYWQGQAPVAVTASSTITAAGDLTVCFDPDGPSGASPPVQAPRSLQIEPLQPTVTAITCPGRCDGGMVTITGSNFDAASNVVVFGGGPAGQAPPTCNVTSTSPSELVCSLYVPPGSSGTWNAAVRVLAKTSNPPRPIAVVNLAPVITQLDMPSCAVPSTRANTVGMSGCTDGSLTITGRGFSTIPGGNRVAFEAMTSGTPPATGSPPTCTPTASTALSITCTVEVPAGTLGTWSPRVTVGGVTSTTEVLTLSLIRGPPIITSVAMATCSSGSPGLSPQGCTDGVLTITGRRFNPTPLSSNEVSFTWAGPGSSGAPPSCTPVSYVSPNGDVLRCPMLIPPHATGPWNVMVAVQGSAPGSGGMATIGVLNAVPEILQITSLYCSSGTPGLSPRGCSPGPLTITGRNFDATSTSANVVTLEGGTAPNGRPECTVRDVAPPANQGDPSTLICDLVVPVSTSGTWALRLGVNGRVSTSPASIAVVNAAPVVEAVSLSSCPTLVNCADGVLTVTGRNFDPTATRNAVELSGGAGPVPTCTPVSSPRPSVLTCPLRVIAGSSGQWQTTVTTGGARSTDRVLLSIANLPPQIVALAGGGGCQPVGVGCTGGPLTITGSRFDPSHFNNRVFFTPATTTSTTPPACPVTSATMTNIVCELSATRGVTGTWYVQVDTNNLSTSNNNVTIHAVPAPYLTALTGAMCMQGGSVVICESGAEVTITGRNFDDGMPGDNTVEMTGQPGATGSPACTVTSVTPSEVRCLLVLGDAYGVFSVWVRTDGVRSPAPLMLRTKSASTPILLEARGGGCTIISPLSLEGCSGGPLTLVGLGLEGARNFTDTRAVLTGSRGIPPTCNRLSSAYLSGGRQQITCQLEVAGVEPRTAWQLKVETTDTFGAQFQSAEEVLLRVLPSPKVTRISGGGCRQQSSVSLVECRGGVLTLTGSGFNPSNASENVVAFRGGTGTPPQCIPLPTQLSENTLQCRLGVAAGSGGTWEMLTSSSASVPPRAADVPVAVSPASNLVPNVVAVSGGGCDGGTSRSRTGCKGGFLTISGDYFPSDAVVTFSGPTPPGPSCPVVTAGVFEVVCQLSSPRGAPSGPWLVTVSGGTSGASVDVVHAPVVFGLEGGGCTGTPLRCAGGVLTISGANFAQPRQVAFVGGTGSAPTCPASSSGTTTRFTCVLRIPDTAQGTWDVVVSAGGRESARVGALQMEGIPPPVVTGASGGGCTQVSSLVLERCSGGTLVINGRNFNRNATRVVLVDTGVASSVVSPTCAQSSVSPSEVLCELSVPPGSSGEWLARVSTFGVDAASTPRLTVVPPPPEVSGVEGGGCTSTGLTLGRCTGGTLLISGSNFHPDTGMNTVAFAGGTGDAPVCRTRKVTTGLLECTLQVIPGSSGRWEMKVITEGRESGTVAEFEASPRLLLDEAVGGGCQSTGRLVLDSCSGGTVVIRANALAGDPGRNVVTFANGAGSPPTCEILAATVDSIECRLSIPQATGNRTWDIFVTSNGQVSGNSVRMGLYFPSSPPSVTSASGAKCLPVDPALPPTTPSTRLQLCRSGILQIEGSQFDIYNPSVNTVQFTGGTGPAPRCAVTGAAVNRITCMLTMGASTSGEWTVAVRTPWFNSSFGGVKLSFHHPAPVAYVPQYFERTGRMITVTVVLDVDAFNPLLWRERCAAFMRDTFTYSAGSPSSITVARVAILSVRAGSTKLDFLFTPERSSSDVPADQLTDNFLEASGRQPDTTGIRRELWLEVAASETSIVLPPDVLGEATAPGDSEGSDESWIEEYWWVILIIIIVLLLLIAIIAWCCCCRGRGKEKEEKKEKEKEKSDMVEMPPKEPSPLPGATSDPSRAMPVGSAYQHTPANPIDTFMASQANAQPTQPVQSPQQQPASYTTPPYSYYYDYSTDYYSPSYSYAAESMSSTDARYEQPPSAPAAPPESYTYYYSDAQA